MSSNRKRTSLRKAHDEITYLKTKLALVEHHNDVLYRFAEGAAGLADTRDVRIQELRTILVELEWSGYAPQEIANYCHVCDGWEKYGHAKECRLAKALADTQPPKSGD